MQRLIRSFNTLTDQLKETLQEQYPDGIDTTHIKTIPTAKGEMLRVIELRTPEAMYLIKINSESRAEIDEFLDQDESSGSAGDDGDDGDDGDEDNGLEGADDAGSDDSADDDVDDDGGADDDDADDGGGDDDDDDDEDE
ncbi:MAG: hypothetical protein IPI81_06250 [Flavobacteriales bacterium]|nr:hypothetical protein [Flavobacteriales bacterium]MCC6937227.1 hypothetical protein [Flavobacteriales bacterium]